MKKHGELEDATEKATCKMMNIVQTPHVDDIEFAKNFIEAQHEVIMCLINEKMSLLGIVSTLVDMTRATDEASVSTPTLH